MNEANGKAMSTLGGAASIGFAAYGPAGRGANVAIATGLAVGGVVLGPPSLHAGDVIVTTTDDHGDHIAVRQAVYDSKGQLKIGGQTYEKCE
jgi:hypothetical protein